MISMVAKQKDVKEGYIKRLEDIQKGEYLTFSSISELRGYIEENKK